MQLTAFLVLAAGPGTHGGVKSPAIVYGSFKHGSAYYHSVTVDMKSGVAGMKTVHAPRLISAWHLIGKEQPIAAITGTFFGLRSQSPVADVLVDGQLVATGDRGSGVGVHWDGGVSVFDTRFKQPFDWSDYQFGLRGAVRVIAGGNVCPDPRAQRFTDSAIWGSAARTAIGTTPKGKLVMFATTSHVTLSELGKAMKSRGVTEGISLDGGSSTCFYYNGSMLIPPGRGLCNMLVITKRV